jgi:hypothetical protein
MLQFRIIFLIYNEYFTSRSIEQPHPDGLKLKNELNLHIKYG